MRQHQKQLFFRFARNKSEIYAVRDEPDYGLCEDKLIVGAHSPLIVDDQVILAGCAEAEGPDSIQFNPPLPLRQPECPD